MTKGGTNIAGKMRNIQLINETIFD